MHTFAFSFWESDQTAEAIMKIIDEYQRVIDRCIAKIDELLDLKK